jgi:hypothetical protein
MSSDDDKTQEEMTSSRRNWTRSVVLSLVVGAALAAGLLVSGCGKGHTSSKSASQPIAESDARKQRALPYQSVLKRTPFFTPKAQFFAVWGPPVKSAPPGEPTMCADERKQKVYRKLTDAQLRKRTLCARSKAEQARLRSQNQCFDYNTVGALPDRTLTRVCFKNGKLVSLVTSTPTR